MTEETKQAIFTVMYSGITAGAMAPLVVRAWNYVYDKIKDLKSKKDRKPKTGE